MGTRADFYVGRGSAAEWLGSIAMDGYPDGIPEDILRARSVDTFRVNVAQFIADTDHGTRPEDGWPWPWEDSRTTDYAYAFDGERTWASGFGEEWFDPIAEMEITEEERDVRCDERDKKGKVAVFPNMKSRQSVTLGRRSGLIIVGIK